MKRVLAMCALALTLTGTSRAGVIVGSYDGGNAYPFSGGPTDEVTTYQQVYDSGSFSDPISITTLSFYQWPDLISGPMDTGTYDIYLSTTSKPVFGLDGDPTNNIGTDNALFGTFNISGDMPSVLTFTGTAFDYDPSAGNLLMTVYTVSGSSFDGFYNAYFWADYTGVHASRMFINQNGTFANDSGALVTGFNAVLEPSSCVLIGLGTIFGFGFVRRRRSAGRV